MGVARRYCVFAFQAICAVMKTAYYFRRHHL